MTKSNSEYLCMDCVNYMKCPVNSGELCDFVKKADITPIERLRKNHIRVMECDKFIKRETITGEILPLPNGMIRQCIICGSDFEANFYDRFVCSNPECKTQSHILKKDRLFERGVIRG